MKTFMEAIHIQTSPMKLNMDPNMKKQKILETITI